MKQIKHILWVLGVVTCVVFARCANQLTPQGGPKDSLPPMAMRATPANGVRHFTGNRIFIEFNEFVKLQDQSKEFFTSPLMKTKPNLVVRGQGVRVDIKDTLKENQTYALNFGSSIRDNNEGNPLSGFRFVFSTGSALDSMLMTGYTADAMKGDSISKAYLFFYPAQLDSIPEYDSLLFNTEPSVVGRGEGNGIFIAQNLKDIPYKVYAFQDNNSNLIYEQGVDKVGFLDEAVNPAHLEPISIWLDEYRHYPTADPQVYFRLFSEQPVKRQNLSGSERTDRHRAVLRFGASYPQIDTLSFDGMDDDRVIREYLTADRDTIALWFNVPPEALPDTIKGRISYLKTDSLGILAPASQQLRLAWRAPAETREEQRERERLERDRERALEEGEEWVEPEKPNPFRFKVDASAQVNPEKSIPIEFDLPLVAIDSMRISLMEAPDLGDPVPAEFHIVRDTMKIRRWTIVSKWDEDSSYELTIPAGVFENIAGERNDSLGARFKITPRSEFATLVLNVTGKSPETEYIIEVLDESGQTHKRLEGVRTGKLTLYYITEGEVRLRITEDGNGNGKWDSGSLVERRQPERVEFYVGPSGDQFIPAKANWEVSINLNMVEIFAPISIEKVRRDLQRAEDARVSKYLEEKALKDAERARQSEGGLSGGGGLGIGGAMGGLRNQVQSTTQSMGGGF